jgi:hypothetical protein
MDKTITINDIQETLNEIFITNLRFFQVEYPSIYNKIIEFENQNSENYSIEFIDNEFNLLKLDDNSNLYKTEPFKDANNRINCFNFSSAFSLIKLEKNERRNHYENEINAYLYVNQFIENFKNIDTDINKFIFIGTLLGVHINDFHNSIKAKSYLIIEPSLEIFRLSMFTTDYKILANESKIFFAIEENDLNLEQIINDFLEYKYYFNNLIHYEISHENNMYLVNKLALIFTHLGEMRYPFSDYLLSLKRGYSYLKKDKIKILNLSKNYNFLEKENIMFLGAGPSLTEHLDWLLLNKDNFIIVAAAATLKQLELFDIYPDIIITIDGQEEPILNQFNVSENLYKNSIILSSIKLDNNVYKLLKNTNIFFIQDSMEIFENLSSIVGVTVGDMGIEALLRLGAKKLYLLGIDAAIDSKTGKTHINTHLSSKNIDLNNIHSEKVDFQKNIVYVKGNFEKTVPTFLEYKEMIEEINNKFDLLNKKFKIYNLSHGAYFNNTIPTNVSQINIKKRIDKDLLKKSFITELKQISKQKLNDLDFKEIQREKGIIKKLSILNLKKDFLKDFEKIRINYLDSIVINIIQKYLKLILPYYNFIQVKNISNKLLKKQISEILVQLDSVF